MTVPAVPYGANLTIADVWLLASSALDKANEVSSKQAAVEAKQAAAEARQAVADAKQAVLDAEIKLHVQWCKDIREADAEAREEDRRVAREWRTGIGERIDWSFKVTWGAAVTIIMLLLGIVGFLLAHGGVKFGG